MTLLASVTTQATCTVATPPASASAAYAAWLTELGVADAAAGFEGDDSKTMFNGVPFLEGATTRMFWSTEGGLGLFYNLPTNESTISLPLNPSLRNYSTSTYPDLLLYCMDAAVGDRHTIDSRKAIAGSTLVLFVVNKYLGGTNGRVEIALRVTTGKIDLVATNVSAATPEIRVYGNTLEAMAQGQTVATGFSGTVAYTLTPTRTGATLNVQGVAGKSLLGRGSATFNARPVPQSKPVDRRDRAPFGLPVQPSELTGPYSIYQPWQFKGRGRIAGTVKEKASPTDKPVARRVRLYREPDGRLIRTVWSDPVTGAYEFYGIPMDARYTVVSHDYNALYRAVLADNLAPELIP